MVFCRACGHTLHVSAPTCPKCGAPQRVVPPAPARGLKSKVTAGLLAILIGGLGVHRFYLGQWWGLFYLLFVWTGIPGVVAFIEGIVFLASDQARWDARHNQGQSSRGSGAGAVLVAVVAVVVGIALVGVLAAIAIPAYQDYTLRAKAATAYAELNTAAAAVADFIEREQRLPATLDDAGISGATGRGVRGLEIDPRTAVITAWLQGQPERGLRFIPSRDVDGAIEWQCEAIGLRDAQAPKPCR
jgi:TM2 domain-containing membrane protein YozV/Tfp pilus assembly major pilin PilA